MCVLYNKISKKESSIHQLTTFYFLHPSLAASLQHYVPEKNEPHSAATFAILPTR